MRETLKNFKNLLSELDIPVNLEEAVELFQEYDDYYSVAIIFIHQFGQLKNITDKFPKLCDDDKSSLILEEILKALTNFKEDGGAKIQTLVSTYVYRRCYAENKMRGHACRALDYDPTLNSSYELHVENSIEIGMDDYYECELLNYLESLDLTDTELKYCKIVSSGEHSVKDSDVARLMEVTPASINYIRKRLVQKFSNVSAFIPVY